MNPATGSFTQMDTYGGSLSDPMSLHKYFFANANPVKYRDPSGHAALILKQETTISMMTILESAFQGSCISVGAYLIGFSYRGYVQGQSCTLKQFATGLLAAFVCGLAIGVISFFAASLLSVLITTLVQGILLATVLFLLWRATNGAADYFYENGNGLGAAIMEALGTVLLIFMTGALVAGLNTLCSNRDSFRYSKTKKDEIKPRKLSNEEARQWYLEQEAKIPEMIDTNLSLEEQAKQAFNLRNQFRTQARLLMSDEELAASLNITNPNLTWEQVVEKYTDQGFTGDALYQEIINASQRSNSAVNQSLGVFP